MRVVVLGPPGAGKGTQAGRLARYLGVPHIATGDMFREAVESGSELGRQVRDAMDSGELVPDGLTNELIKERLSQADASDGFVLDGYPRSTSQAESLDSLLLGSGHVLDAAIRFMVTGPEIVARLSGRRICPACKSVYHVRNNPPAREGICDRDGTPLVLREDDREETVLRRLEIYGEQTKPLLDRYRRSGLVMDIDGLGSEDEVFERVLKALAQAA